MFVIPNQSSVPKAYTQFTDENAEEGGSRMVDSSNRMRVVDCMEEFVKYTILMKPNFGLFGDRCSERMERAEKEERAAKENMEMEKTKIEKKKGKDGELVVRGLVNGVDVGKI